MDVWFRQILGGPLAIFVLTIFYIENFNSALTSQVFVQKSEGRVKIYQVQMINMEMYRGPPKLQTNSQADAIVSWAIFIFEENMFLSYTLSHVLQDNFDSMVWYGPPNGKVGVQIG